MIALGFEDISVLVFHLPSSSSCLNNLGDSALGEGKIGNKGILIENWLQVLTCAKLSKVNECEGDEFEAEMIFLFCLKA